MKHPDPKAHLFISLVKSMFRICAGGLLCFGHVIGAGVFLIAAEILGIVEELV